MKVLRTYFSMTFLIWHEVISLKWHFWPHVMFIGIRKYLVPHFIAQDFRIKVKVPLVSYVFTCHLAPGTPGAFGYVPYQSGIIQGHPGHRYKRSPRPVLCTFTRCRHLDYFPMLYICKVYLDELFLLFLHPCYALVVMPNRRNNKNNFSKLHRVYVYKYLHTGEF